MASKEDYLDDLLKKIANGEQPETDGGEVQPETEVMPETESASETETEVEAAESEAESITEPEFDMAALLQEITGGTADMPEGFPETDGLEGLDLGSSDMPEGFPEIDGLEGLDLSSLDIPEEFAVPDVAEEPQVEDVTEEPLTEEPFMEDQTFEDAAEEPSVADMPASFPETDDSEGLDLGSLDMPEGFPETDGLEGVDLSSLDIPEEFAVPDVAEEPQVEDVTEDPLEEESLEEKSLIEEPFMEDQTFEDAAEEPSVADMSEGFPETDDLEGLDLSSLDIPEEFAVPDVAEEPQVEDVTEKPLTEESIEEKSFIEEPFMEDQTFEDAAEEPSAADMPEGFPEIDDSEGLDLGSSDMPESFPEIDDSEGLDLGSLDIPEEFAVPDVAEEPQVEEVTEDPLEEESLIEDPLIKEQPFEDAAEEPSAADMSEGFPEIDDSEGLDLGSSDMPESFSEMDSLEGVDLSSLDIPDEFSVSDMAEEAEPVPEAESEDAAGFDAMPETASDLDSVMGMSEEDIARLLTEGAEGDETGAPDEADVSEADILSLLGDAGDEDVQEIRSMLEKSDNNEAVDEKIEELLQENSGDEGNPEERFPSDGGGANDELSMLLGDSRKAKALEKKRLKEEKAAAKKAAKEAKKAAKEAKKREKLAKKKRAGKDVQDIPVHNEDGEELLFDKDVLDRLVARAGKIKGDEPEEGDAVQEAEESTPAETGEDMAADLGLDLDSIFGGSVETSEADAEPAVEQAVASEDAAPKDGKKKQGFIARIMAFLMEDDEDEENENIRLSGENKEILNELDQDGKKVKGGKGGKGGKNAKKDKKKAKSEKEQKPQKPAKPKKEKKPKKPEEPEPYVPPRKRLTFKKALPVLLLGLTMGAALFILSNISINFADKHAAKTAYYQGDYMTCYQNLYGKELNESEKVMYGTSESILYIRLWYREYEMLANEGAEVEALDSLIQTVKDYPKLYEYASRWNAQGEVYEVYAVILNILSTKYGLTELQAREIAKVRDDVEYTRRVVAIVEGKGYGSWDGTGGTSGQTGGENSLPDKLPEESEMGQGNFVDNK